MHRNGSLAVNRVLAAFVGAVVLLAVIAAVLVANRDTPDLDRGTPQGVVQEFLQAVFNGEDEAAAALLSSSTGCGASDLAFSHSSESSPRIVLDDVTLDGEKAVVTVNVTEGSGNSPFESSGYSHKERINVQREGGVWKVTAASWLLPGCDSTKGRP